MARQSPGHEDGVVANTQFVHQVQQFPYIVVCLHHRIGKVAVARNAGKIRMGQCGEVHLGKRHVGIEWFARFDLSP
jgi:hypothetical protein